jgi:hypothetical protein
MVGMAGLEAGDGAMTFSWHVDTPFEWTVLVLGVVIVTLTLVICAWEVFQR